MCIIIESYENGREVADEPWPFTKMKDEITMEFTKMFINTASYLGKSDNYNHESKE